MGADEWDDPHDLIPETFKREYGDSETIADALRRAESRPSATPDSDRRCCRECYSAQITPKSDSSMSDSTQRLEGAWRCINCGEHFNEPLDMNPKATAFDWIDTDDLSNPDERGDLEGPLADLSREQSVRYAILLRAPWRDGEPLSYPEIAGALPFSGSWVGARVREWRDGEHRELVPEPTAEPEPAPSNDPPIDPRAAVARIGGSVPENSTKNLVESEPAGTENVPSGTTVDEQGDTGALATDGGRRSRWDAYGSD